MKARDVFAQAFSWCFRWYSTALHHGRFLSEFLHLFSFRDVPLKNLYDFLSVMDFVSIQPILSLLLKFLNLRQAETFTLRKREGGGGGGGGGGGEHFPSREISSSLFSKNVLLCSSWDVPIHSGIFISFP